MKGTNCLQSLCYNSQLSLLLGTFSPCTLNMLIRRVRESHKVPPLRLVFSYCRLLPPSEIAKSFLANGMIGRGGGDRIPRFQCSQGLAKHPAELKETT
jgi:hypothetical protein